jgi:hypothetical protein
MQTIRKGESITTGVVAQKGVGGICTTVDKLVEENVPFSRVYTINQGKFGSVDVDWLACGTTICHYPERRFLALSQKGGHILRMGGGESGIEELSPCMKGFKRKPGLMREIRGIAGGRAYAVGTGRQAYRRENTGVWRCIDQWSQTDSRELTRFSFESIDGFSEEDIYAVGWEGEIWHYDGKKFKQIQSPTNLSLHQVKCAADGLVYIVGKNGILIRGRDEQWEVIEQDQTTSDIWGVAWFQGCVYVATTQMVFGLANNNLERIDFKEGAIPASCYHLSTTDDVLWSIGPEDIVEFDGKNWTRIV